MDVIEDFQLLLWFSSNVISHGTLSPEDLERGPKMLTIQPISVWGHHPGGATLECIFGIYV